MNKTVFFKTFRRLFGFVLAISLSASVLTAQAQNARITLNLSDVPMSQVMKEIEKQMADDEFLLIACKSFDKSAINISDKIKIKKIPQMLLGKCEFGKDDYSLNIVNPPVYEYEEEDCDE